MNVNTLNARAVELCRALERLPFADRLARHELNSGTTLWDFGVDVPGGLMAGIWLARCCVADLAEIRVVQHSVGGWHGPAVSVATDQPIDACIASQYAGWKISVDDFFAMGSGPMRALTGKEEMLRQMNIGGASDYAVGILEAAQLPTDTVAQSIAKACAVETSHLILLAARTASLAGTVQIVARSIETALHKMYDLGFDLREVVSGFGLAPIPPVADSDLVGIGRTNDSILYGADVTLWMDSADEQLESCHAQIPSSASDDYGLPFQSIFERYDRDFYRIDPHLFSPARIRLINLRSGRSYVAGTLRGEILESSFTASDGS